MDATCGLLEVDVYALTYSQQLDYALALEQHSAKIAAASARTFAAIEAGGVPGVDPKYATKQMVREEVALTLTISPWMAMSRFSDAADLVNKLPATLAQLEAGETSYWHARALIETTNGLSPDVLAAVLDRIGTKATTQTVTEFRQTIKRAIASVDPETFEERHKKAAAKRGVWLREGQDGMSWVNTCTTTPDAVALYTSLTNIATTPTPVAPGEEPDPRSADNRRADALVDIVLAAEQAAEESGQHMPAEQGRRATIQVSVALSTLAGIDIQPAELIGHGPIPASLALQLAFDQTSTWRRLITDDTGRALDYPLTTYRPPTDLRDFVIARDNTCRAPGCNRLARNCDIDHHFDHALGGPTSSLNLGPLCGRNHQPGSRWSSNQPEEGDSHGLSPDCLSPRDPACVLEVDRAGGVSGAGRNRGRHVRCDRLDLVSPGWRHDSVGSARALGALSVLR